MLSIIGYEVIIMHDVLNMYDWDGLTYTNYEDAEHAAHEATQFFDDDVVCIASVYS